MEPAGGPRRGAPPALPAATAERAAELSPKSLLFAAVTASLLCGGAALAGESYLQAVRDAESALAASHVSKSTLKRVRSELLVATSCSQPEIDADLTVQPPELGDARARLHALDRALAAPPRPGHGTEQALRNLALQSPYNREQPEAPGDYLDGTFQSLLARLAAAACGGVLALILQILKWIALAAAAIALAVLGYRLVLRYRRRDQPEHEGRLDAERVRTAAERFAAADRLAAAGDLAAAIRELAGAVATVLGGEATWDLSPLTVREIYAGAGRLDQLRPLLRAFEESVYGHRAIAADAYSEAEACAAPYRPVGRRAA